MIDIIIPTYDNSGYTVRCLKSIKENTVLPYRVIWVDDGSKITECQKVLDKLEEFEIEFEMEGTIENRGFAKIVNVGIKLSTSDPIILLNNDVIVTKGWLLKLVSVFQFDKGIGVVGSVTDKCGSRQQYERLMKSLRRPVPKVPDRYFNNLLPEVIPVNSNVSYFCVAISRKLIDTIGLLDEGFLNGGEDDDYNDRARLAGFKTAIALNCFVWHEHEATRRKVLNRETRRKNVELYLTKRAKRRI